MGRLKEVINDAHLERVHIVIDTNDQKYLCFTRLSLDSWILNVTDGFDLWKSALDMDDLDTHCDQADATSVDAFLMRFRLAFTAGEVQVSRSAIKLTLSVGEDAKALCFDLYEAKALEKRTELQTVLFHLAETATHLGSRLDVITKQLHDAKQQKPTTSAMTAPFDLDSTSWKKVQKKIPRSAGMSVLNPGSKRRKAAHGVEFD